MGETGSLHVCVCVSALSQHVKPCMLSFRYHKGDSFHKNAVVCAEMRSKLGGFEQTSTVECTTCDQTTLYISETYYDSRDRSGDKRLVVAEI